jgi:hypothetical protein
VEDKKKPMYQFSDWLPNDTLPKGMMRKTLPDEDDMALSRWERWFSSLKPPIETRRVRRRSDGKVALFREGTSAIAKKRKYSFCKKVLDEGLKVA